MKHTQCLLALSLAAGLLGGCKKEDKSEAKESVTPPATTGTLAVTYSDTVAIGLVEGGMPQAQVDNAKSKVNDKLGLAQPAAAALALQDPGAFDQNDPVAVMDMLPEAYTEAMMAEPGADYALFLKLLTSKSFAFINANLADKDKKALLDAFSAGTLAGMDSAEAQALIDEFTGYLYEDMDQLIPEAELAAYSEAFFGTLMEDIKAEQPAYDFDENYAELGLATYKLGEEFVAGLSDAAFSFADDFVSDEGQADMLAEFTALNGDYIKDHAADFDADELADFKAEFDAGLIDLVGAEAAADYSSDLYDDFSDIFKDEDGFLDDFKEAYNDAIEEVVDESKLDDFNDQLTEDVDCAATDQIPNPDFPGSCKDAPVIDPPADVMYMVKDTFADPATHGYVSAAAALALGFTQEQLDASQVEADMAVCTNNNQILTLMKYADGLDPAFGQDCYASPDQI